MSCRLVLQQGGGAGPAPDAANIMGPYGQAGVAMVAAASVVAAAAAAGAQVSPRLLCCAGKAAGAVLFYASGEQQCAFPAESEAAWRRFLQTMAQAAAVCPVLHGAGGKARRQLAELGPSWV